MPPETTGVPARPWKARFRGLTALLFIAAGVNHFLDPAFYMRIIPPHFPSPAMLVSISGIAEIAGGMGLLVPSLRRAASFGLILLLIAVFPANLYMALAPEKIPNLHLAHWLLWLRLPLQGVFIAWVWLAGAGTSAAASPRSRL